MHRPEGYKLISTSQETCASNRETLIGLKIRIYTNTMAKCIWSFMDKSYGVITQCCLTKTCVFI